MPVLERLRRRRAAAQAEKGEFNSLFGEIMDWMLAPLMFVWPISIAITHSVVDDIANVPYDKVLSDTAYALSRSIEATPVGAALKRGEDPRALLRVDDEDVMYFQLLGGAGELLTGDPELPAVALESNAKLDTVYYRASRINNEDVRIAYLFVPVSTIPGSYATVQVAETLNKRQALTSRILSGVLLPQFAIIPLAVVLVYFGLGRGLRPLSRLQDLIQKRRQSDLSPIDMRGLPEEVRPLITAFNDMMFRLEQNIQAQQRFIADAAHQMRTPLTGLKSQAELALAESDPAQIRESLARIGESADRAAHLINQLLALARAEASHEKTQRFEPLQLEALVRSVTQDWVPRALSKGVDLGLEDAGVSLPVEGVPLLLREMLGNLVDNAIKYTPPGGHVTVRVSARDADGVVEVEDTGCGVPEADRERVFERFYRVLGVQGEGSGLGLPIVREIALLHRGDVFLEAGAHRSGTSIKVILPLVHA